MLHHKNMETTKGNNMKKTFEELEAEKWYSGHIKELKKHNLDPLHEDSFTKLEKFKWEDTNKTCIKCDNLLTVGQKKFCTDCKNRYSSFTDLGLMYGG